MDNISKKLGMKGASSRPFIILALSIIVLMGAVFIVNAEKNGPVPGSGGTYITPYDWMIEAGDDILWEDSTIIVNGNLSILSGGKLTLNQVNLRMNCTVDGLRGIEVQSGGELLLTNCVITSVSSSGHFRMILDGTVLMESSSVSEVFGDPQKPWDHGIELRSSDIQILNSSFSKCQGDVFHVESSSPLIRGNRFYENMGAAIFTNGTSSPRILENHVYRQRFGIVSGFYSSPVIDGNEIYDIENNGILLNGYMSPIVSNNTVYRCLNGMFLWYSNARLENNEVHNNEAGYNIKVDSRPVITNDLVRDNQYVGISANDSVVQVIGSSITGQLYDGIRSFNGSSVKVRNSDIRNNGDDGFQVTDAHAEVHGSTIAENDGDGLFLRDFAVMDLFETTVSGGNPPMGYYQINLEGRSTITLHDSDHNENSVTFGDEHSKLVSKRTFDFLVIDRSSSPIADILIDIRNETGTRRTLGTDVNGEGSRYLTLYDQKDLNGDGDGKDPAERLDHTYNFTIEEPGYRPYFDEIDLEFREQIRVVLDHLPTIRAVESYPVNGDVGIPTGTSIYIIFNKDIDPGTVDLEFTGPGGTPVLFESTYYPGDLTLELHPFSDLDHSTTYTVRLIGVSGATGEILEEPFYFTFHTVATPEPDNDEDGTPDKDDLDDDNDGYEDVVEEYFGTDPLDPEDYPMMTDDDDDGSDPGTEPDPPADDDDDDDGGIVIIPDPVTDDDDDITVNPYDPVNTSSEIPQGSDDGMNYIILIIGTVIGLIILVGVMLMIFLKSGSGQKLAEMENTQRPPYGG